jgi:hypothetical protein
MSFPLTYKGGAAVTLSDSVDDPALSTPNALAGCFAALEATTASGLVKVTCLDGSVLTVYLTQGLIKPLQVKRVWSSVTAATGIVGYYPAGLML